MNTRTRIITLFGLAAPLAMGLGLLTGAPPAAEAFCGFYVAGADTKLFNDATMVVLMRDGKRTVLAMQNDYQGPPEDFAMVVPVPVVLSEETVKTLPKEVFDRVDKLASPRLVEYWEEDPCAPRHEYDKQIRGGAIPSSSPPTPEGSAEEYGVKIEAQFTVAEYEIVILSASDSTGLDGWLRDSGYKIPPGAEPLLRPYVEEGMKFFVAKVDTSKVTFESRPDGSKRATLSPLRFHYDSDQFALPIRLGLINAPEGAPGEGQGGQAGAQDLIVHVLARNTRYQVANYPNVTIPTNLEVKDETREHFGQFYVSLFDHTLVQTPKAVVTEYAWSANTCDPCPEPALTLAELVTLGADVLPTYAAQLGGGGQQEVDSSLEWSIPSEFVLTRLHARYDSSTLGEDLVFEEAPAIAGGREFLQTDGKLERGSQPYSSNNFQARYIIRHPWTGPIACANPERGIWGGPPAGVGNGGPIVARKLATVDRGASLGSFVTAESQAILGVADVPPVRPAPEAGEGGEVKSDPDSKAAPEPKPADAKQAADDNKAAGKGCACEVDDRSTGGLGLLGLFGLLTFTRIRRPREESQA
jgi:MYXO-CTERM domain-containing protein